MTLSERLRAHVQNRSVDGKGHFRNGAWDMMLEAADFIDWARVEIAFWRTKDWQPIDTAPKDGTTIVLYEGFEPTICSGCWIVVDEYWMPGRGGTFWKQPTHWKPYEEPK